MTAPDTVVFNSRERAMSTDMNRQGALDRRAVMDAVGALSSGMQRLSGCFGNSFIVTPVAGTMKSTITDGYAVIYNSAAVYPAARLSLIESSSIREVTHEAADGNPRYDVVEVRAGTTVSLTEPRDVYNQLLGTFTVANLAKEIRSYPEFQVRKGTPAVSPSIPAGTAGWMPLAYVLVPGGALSLLPTNVVYCRPILDTMRGEPWVSPAPTAIAGEIKGGGLSCPGGTLTASVVNSMRGRFPGHRFDFRVDAGVAPAVTSMVYDGGGVPGASGALYFYAVPAPYPAGYDSSMAPREFWTPDTAVVYGANSGFTDAARQSGCIVVVSTNSPSLSTPQGAPAVAGTGTINHTFFSAAASSLDRTKWVYLGAASYDQTDGFLSLQTCVGPQISTDRKPGKNFFALLPIAADTTFDMWAEATGESVIRWPTTARNIKAKIVCSMNANTALYFAAIDSFASSTIPNGAHYQVVSNPLGAAAFGGVELDMMLNSSGQFTVKAASGTASSAKIYGRSYTDAVLRMR